MRSGALALRHGSLFSGIGGFDLAAQWMGWTNVFHCELDPFCKRVLQHYFPKAQSHEDIKKTDFSVYRGGIDILTGGFPCQPYSLAGKRLGKEDERHLWPDMLRAIREIRPVWVVAENVLGIISWNEGVVFEEVQSDLEAEGYYVQPYVLPAAGVDAPHRRDRVWFVAYRGRIGWDKRRRNSDGEVKNKAVGGDLFIEPERPGEIGSTANTNDRQQQEQQECRPEDRGSAPAPRSSIGFGASAGNIDRDTAERIRQLGAGASFLQETAANTDSIGRDDGGDNRQERPVQADQRTTKKDQSEREIRQRGISAADPLSADTNLQGLEGETGQRIQAGTRGADRVHHVEPAWFSRIEGWENFPQTQPSVRIGDDGLPDQLDFDTVFEGIPFPVKPITFSKWRTESIKALGNAIVPQVALQLFKTIQRFTVKFQKHKK